MKKLSKLLAAAAVAVAMAVSFTGCAELANALMSPLGKLILETNTDDTVVVGFDVYDSNGENLIGNSTFDLTKNNTIDLSKHIQPTQFFTVRIVRIRNTSIDYTLGLNNIYSGAALDNSNLPIQFNQQLNKFCAAGGRDIILFVDTTKNDNIQKYQIGQRLISN